MSFNRTKFNLNMSVKNRYLNFLLWYINNNQNLKIKLFLK